MTMRHPAARATVCVCDVSKPTRDPTGTYDVRRRFKIATDLRWRKFGKLLRQTIISQDILGLGPEVSGALQLSFANLPAEARLRSLQSWTDDMLRRVVLEDGAAYLDPMSSIGYNRAITRAQRLTGTKVVPPDAADAIGLLQHLAMTELQGIAEVASQQIVRVGSTAILERKTQAQAIREMNEVIERIGVVRSRAMVELIIVKAHATGTLDTFAAAGVKRVGLLPETRPGKKLTGDADKPVAPAQGRRGTSASTISRIKRAEKEVEKALPEMVEVLTAGDDLVCEECEGIAADGPYTIDEARGLIPAHPHCRCSFVPEGSELFGVFSDDEWNEEDHPREEGGPDGGQFTSGGNAGPGFDEHANRFAGEPIPARPHLKKELDSVSDNALRKMDPLNKLTDERDKIALNNYYTPQHAVLNDALRKGTLDEMEWHPRFKQPDMSGKEAVARMDRIYAEHSVELKKDTILFRGMNTPDLKFKAGMEFEDKGFASTSPTYSGAAIYGETMMHITVPKKTKVIGTMVSEREVTLNRGTKFRVTAVHTVKIQKPGEKFVATFHHVQVKVIK